MEKKIFRSSGRSADSPVSKKGESGSCRYTKDFEEISQIGSGNYGKVFLVRNRLDNSKYAIKKVPIKFSDKILLHLKEAHILAKLNHPNIVSYKTSWIKWNKPLLSVQDAKCVSLSQKVSTDNTSSDSIIFADSSSTTSKSQSLASTYRTLSSEEDEPDEKCYFATLYIQMSLCDKTLAIWLKDRNNNFQINSSIQSKDQDFFIKDTLCIFKQLTKGVNYIHEMHIVHHDINPNNVFMSVNNCNCKHPTVQLGDFGLASYRRGHTFTDGAMGTMPYLAPEQLRGKSCHKSDIYSLGVILLELMMPINTVTELVEVIKKVKIQEQSQQPFDPCPRFPKIKNLIRRLLSDKTESRPTAYDVIKIIRFIAIAMKVNCDQDLKEILREKNGMIRSLKNQLRAQEKTIKNLTEKINELECEMPFGPRGSWKRGAVSLRGCTLEKLYFQRNFLQARSIFLRGRMLQK